MKISGTNKKKLFLAQFQHTFSESLAKILMIPSVPLGENNKWATRCPICLECDSGTAHFMSSGRKSRKCWLSNVWWGFVLSTVAPWVMALCAYEATKSICAKPNWEKRTWHIHGSQWTSKKAEIVPWDEVLKILLPASILIRLSLVTDYTHCLRSSDKRC